MSREALGAGPRQEEEAGLAPPDCRVGRCRTGFLLEAGLQEEGNSNGDRPSTRSRAWTLGATP